MIVEAKYEGPLIRVSVPGYEHRVAERGQTVKIRIPQGRPLGGHWKIIKGKKAYDAGLKAAETQRKDRAKALAAAQEKSKDDEAKRLDEIVESGQTAETE